MNLQNLELRILDLHSGLSLRPTLDRAGSIGELLQQAKDALPHGEWVTWCGRLPFKMRTVQTYVQVWKAQTTASITGSTGLPETCTIDQFLRMMRQKVPAEVAEVDDTPALEDARIVTADCRAYKWPTVDVCCTDPPWAEPDAYDWLGVWAAEKLKPGGLLLCQCGTSTLPDRIARLTAGGLRYRWLLAIVFKHSSTSRPFGGFLSTWLPVVVCSKGKTSKLALSADSVQVRGCEKVHGPWQQPTKPYFDWLSRWSLPGDVVCDPFVGTGSVGCAVRAIGGRRFLGTEQSERSARVARKRIAAVVPGSGWRQDIDD